MHLKPLPTPKKAHTDWPVMSYMKISNRNASGKEVKGTINIAGNFCGFSD